MATDLPGGRPVVARDLLPSGRRSGSILRWVPAEVFDSPELLEIASEALADDLAMLASYSCSAGVLSTPLRVLCGSKDPLVTGDSVAGWARFSCSQVAVEEVPGGHFLLDDNYDRLLAGWLAGPQREIMPYASRLVLFRAMDQSSLGNESADLLPGWSSLAEEFKVHDAPGSHHTMMDPGNVEYLGRVVRDYLRPGATS